MKVLIIDDSSSERMFLQLYLQKAGHKVLCAADGASGVSMYAESNPDLVLLDMMMPDMDGRETVRRMRAIKDEWVPVIFLSGLDRSEDIEAALDAGGDDYLIKPFQPKTLGAKMRSMARIAAMRANLVEANAKLKRLAEVDGLTGVSNRFHLDQKMKDEFARCGRSGQALSTILLDIDHFKRFNDTYGHAVGDECLRLVARTIAAEVRRPADLVARYGGEEFCVLLPETPSAGAAVLAETLRQQVAGLTLETPLGPTRLTISLGVATDTPQGQLTPADLLKRSDEALYQAKHAGRNAVKVAA